MRNQVMAVLVKEIVDEGQVIEIVEVEDAVGVKNAQIQQITKKTS